MQARYGAASEVGFAKAEYDEFGNRKMSSNTKQGLAGAGLAGLGAAQIVRANNLPRTTAEATQRAVIARREAARQLKTAQQERLALGNPSKLNVAGRIKVNRAKERVTSRNIALAGAKNVERTLSGYQANTPYNQKMIRRAGVGGVVAGLGLAGVAARRGMNNMQQQAGA